MKLLPIGRFSKMVRLSIKALRLYDKMGLLRPAHVDPSSGYRYYDPGQAKRAEIIRALRAVAMPLEEIRQIVDTDNKVMARQHLQNHKDRLAEQLASQQRMLSYLESIIQHTEKVMPYEITTTEMQPQLIAAVKIHTNLTKISNDIATGFADLVTGLSLVDASANGAPMILYHAIIDEHSEGDIEVCVPIDDKISGGDSKLISRELPGGTVAMTTHHGPYEQISSAYHTLSSWISENDYQVIGPVREIYLNDPRLVSADDLMTRLVFPIGREA